MKKVLLLTVMCVLGLFGVRAQETITIGEGSGTASYLPLDMYNGYGICQQLYLADEIGYADGGTITSLAVRFFGETASSSPVDPTDRTFTRNVRIYVEGADYNVLEGGVNLSDNSVQCFDGTVTYVPGEWTEFVFDTPYSYDGGNILITMYDYTGEVCTNYYHFYADIAYGLTSWANITSALSDEYLFTKLYNHATGGNRNQIQLTIAAAGEEGDDNTGEEGDDNTGEEGDDNTGEDEEFLICERFDNYEAGDKVAEKGNECWTTWSKKVGGAEDGVIVDLDGNKCAYLEKGNDQVINLGGYAAGSFELEFDVYVPEGNSGYYNILHNFAGGNSVWAMQGYFHLTDDGSTDQVDAPGHGTIHAGGNSVADMTCIYDAWMHLRFVIDINNDLATLYSTFPEAEEVKVVEWQWSKDSYDESTKPNRKLDAMNFYPPTETSAFYLDNFTLKQLSAAAPPTIGFDKELSASAAADDIASVEVTIENTGLAIADYTAWINYGVSEGGNKVNFVNYDSELSDSTIMTAISLTEPTIIEVGAMYPGAAYTPSVAGTKVTHVSYPFIEVSEGNFGIVEGSEVVFRIYGQGANNMPGEVLAEKAVPYSEIKHEEFLKAKLDEPVVLTGFDVWATVSFWHDLNVDKVSAPILFDGEGDKAAPYGDLIRIGNEGPFYFANEAFQSKYGNIHIRMTCAGDPVLGGWAEIDGKVYGTLQAGETATMDINMSTFGLKKGETYEAKLVVDVANAESLFETPLTLYVWGENVNEILSNTYSIYPNPTTGMVTVEGENINFVAVYNSVGQLVKVVKTQSNVVDMSAYENGVYFFNIVDNAGQNSVQRVVVAK